MGGALVGVDGVPVEVEVRISSQLPGFDVVGLPEAAVRESAARVRAAIGSLGLPFPDRRVTVNLAPAGLRKSGAGLDLPIAIGILAAAGSLEPEALGGLGLLGELALDGRVRDRKSTRLNSSHLGISYAVFCLKKKNNKLNRRRTARVP